MVTPDDVDDKKTPLIKSFVEQIYGKLIEDERKNMAQIEHSRHRSLHGFVTNLMAGLAAYSFS